MTLPFEPDTDRIELGDSRAGGSRPDEPRESPAREARPVRPDPSASGPRQTAPTEPDPAQLDPAQLDPGESDPGESDPGAPGPGESDRAPAPPARRVWLLAAVALAVLVIDLVTKLLAVRHLEWRPPMRVLDGLVYIQLVRNPGAAFGLATGMTWLLTLIAVGVVVAIMRVAGRLRSPGWAVALGLVLGGALGNLIDRLFRYPGTLRGWVVDMVSVFAPDGRVWPVFNAADSAICTGGALLVLLAVLGIELDGVRQRNARTHGEAGEPDRVGERAGARDDTQRWEAGD